MRPVYLFAAVQDGRKRLIDQEAEHRIQCTFHEGEGQVEHQQAGKQAIDIGVDGLVHADDGIYDYTKFEGEKGKKRTADEQIDYLEELINKYPIDSIEDGMSENDWDGWKKLTDRIGNRCQLVGDDLFVTNVDFLAMGIEKGCANSIFLL